MEQENINVNEEEVKDEAVVNQTNETTDVDSGNDNAKTFTQDELDAILAKRLEREFKKYSENLEAEKAEAERLAKLSADERLKEEQTKFEEERTQFLTQKAELEATKLLNQKGLPIEFTAYVTDLDAEKMTSNIEAFETIWNEALAKEVGNRLKSKTPTTSTTTVVEAMTKQEFAKLSTNERAKLMEQNPNILEQLK